jgi:hypothetical protein
MALTAALCPVMYFAAFVITLLMTMLVALGIDMSRKAG